MLVFVYNADSGAMNTLLDSAHKILSPATYQCQLCQLSYGIFNENQAWKSFREGLSEEVVFLHKDEFEQQYAMKYQYPVLLRVETGEVTELLSANDFRQTADTQSLIDLCKKSIAR